MKYSVVWSDNQGRRGGRQVVQATSEKAACSKVELGPEWRASCESEMAEYARRGWWVARVTGAAGEFVFVARAS